MVIVDASIVYSWITEEDNGTNSPTFNLLYQSLNTKENVLVPDIILYELANALSTKTNLTIEEAKEAWNVFGNLHLKIINPDLKFIEECLKFSKKHHVSVYDASYAILALEKKSTLFTADSKFVKQINLPFIKLL